MDYNLFIRMQKSLNRMMFGNLNMIKNKFVENAICI
jgi:hypothetical protein